MIDSTAISGNAARSNAARLIGLAPLAKLAFGGTDLAPLGAELVARASANPDDSYALMDLSTVLHLSGQRDIALAVQAQALASRKVYRYTGSRHTPSVTVLVFMAPGDLTENNALEFLVEGTDVALELLYIAPGEPLPEVVPTHDLAFVAVCESERNRPLLDHLAGLLTDWPRPVINAPHAVGRLTRDGACALLGHIDGVMMPHTVRLDRSALGRLSRGEEDVSRYLPRVAFPLIVRPIDSHKGEGQEKIEGASDLTRYLETVAGEAFFVAPFVDYRSDDGLCRKYRIVLIGGSPYVCHVAIADHWKLHYMSAGMCESVEKRAMEARFMERFDEDFARRHAAALQAIYERVGLEYVGIDCGETPDGQLLIFEFDSGMTVHAMDPADVFPYKQVQMRKVFTAFRDMLAAAARR